MTEDGKTHFLPPLLLLLLSLQRGSQALLRHQHPCRRRQDGLPRLPSPFKYVGAPRGGGLRFATPDDDLGDDTNAAPTKYGRKSYWESMYRDEIDDEYSADTFSWYCGWSELRPFFHEFVPDRSQEVLVVGCGNDLAPVSMFDEGWRHLTAFDYSAAGIERMGHLFGHRRLSGGTVTLLQADARALPLPDAAFDAALDKGSLDAIFISGEECLRAAVAELTRVTRDGGCVVSLSRVVPPDLLRGAFAAAAAAAAVGAGGEGERDGSERGDWEELRDGSLAFAPDGEATIDLGANLFVWRRRRRRRC